MCIRVGHAKTDRNLIEKKDRSARLPRGSEVVSGVKEQLEGAGFEVFPRQDRTIRAAVAVRDGIGKLGSLVFGNPKQLDTDTFCGTAARRVENVSRLGSGVAQWLTCRKASFFISQ